MTVLRKFAEDDARQPRLETSDSSVITAELAAIGVRFERWNARAVLAPDADQEAVIAAYRADIDRLMRESGYHSVDVVRIAKGTPDTEPMRRKFLDEHTHSEDEVRFFVEGEGAFYLRRAGHVYQVVCARNDLISVPAGTTHWFDMGPHPHFTAIRLFTNTEGWIAAFTGA